MVTVSLTSGSGSLTGTVTLNIGTSGGNGTVSYTDLKIDLAGTKQLTASASGGSLSDAVSDPFVVASANTAPTAISPSFSPASPRTNDTLIASTTTADSNGDNVSVGAWTWKVTRGANTCVVQNNTSLAAPAGNRSASLDLSTTFSTTGCTGPTPPATINPSRGDTVVVEATPNDGTVNGTLVSSSVLVADTAPTATVDLNPTAPRRTTP